MPATTPKNSTSERLISLDAFRGATILGMVLVNNPGTWGAMYGPLKHAEWHGWTPTDLVFPWFVFIVGTALALAMKKYGAPPLGKESKPLSAVYGRILRRSASLMGLGLLLAASGGIFYALGGDFSKLSFTNLRLPGVLQRIALVYLAVSLLVLHVGWRGQLAIALAILAGYATLLHFHPSHDDHAANLSNTSNLVRQVDLAVLGANHMYSAEPTDPEGLLSTLPAIVTALLGYWAGLAINCWPRSLATIGKLALIGAFFYLAGEFWHQQGLPVNKKLWTSSFVLVTGGLAMVGLAVCYGVFDLLGVRQLALPLAIVGQNPITVFVGSGLVGRLLTVLKVGSGEGAVTLQAWLYKTLFTNWVSDPKMASLAYALTIVALWWLAAFAMWRKGWMLRV